jgi:hypothetical protein
MRIRSGRSHKPVTSRARKPDDLLGIWLDLLKRFDDAPRRRAAKLRRTQRARRSIEMRVPPSSGGLALQAFVARPPDHVDLINVSKPFCSSLSSESRP